MKQMQWAKTRVELLERLQTAVTDENWHVARQRLSDIERNRQIFQPHVDTPEIQKIRYASSDKHVRLIKLHTEILRLNCSAERVNYLKNLLAQQSY